MSDWYRQTGLRDKKIRRIVSLMRQKLSSEKLFDKKSKKVLTKPKTFAIIAKSFEFNTYKRV